MQIFYGSRRLIIFICLILSLICVDLLYFLKIKERYLGLHNSY